MLKIYGVPKSRTFRTLWAAEETGVPYEIVPVSFGAGERGTRSEWFLAINPNGHIPVIDDEGFVLWESLAINLYLARRYGRGLYPGGSTEEADVLRWTLWIAAEVEGTMSTLLYNRAWLPPEKRDPAAADAAEQKLRAPLGVLDAHVSARPFLLGETYTVADLNVACVLYSLVAVKHDFTPWPHLQRWLATCLSRPAAVKAQKMREA
jgi:glutathione S-transferase